MAPAIATAMPLAQHAVTKPASPPVSRAMTGLAARCSCVDLDELRRDRRHRGDRLRHHDRGAERGHRAGDIDDRPQAEAFADGCRALFSRIGIVRICGSSAISKMASISTVMLLGSEPMPTAERAWRPASPNTVDEQIGAAVDHLGWSLKSGVGVDHAEQLHHPRDPAEVAEGGMRDGEEVEAGEPRMVIGLLDADARRRPCRCAACRPASRGPWPGDEEQRVRRARRARSWRRDRRRHQREAEFLEAS